MGNYCCTEWLDSLWTPIPPLCVLAFKTVLVAVFWMNLALPVVKEGFIDDKANLIIRNYVYLWAIIAFHIVYLLLLISFMLAMFITPGNIPKVNPWRRKDDKTSKLSEEEIQLITQVYQIESITSKSFKVYKDLDTDVRERLRRLPVIEIKGFDPTSGNVVYRSCKTCKMFKPDRTHHCRRCGTCRLKMDHHCPWIMNCVGFHNQKYFILMLLYGATSALMYASIMLPRMIQAFQSFGKEDTRFGSEVSVIFSWFMAFLMIYPMALFTIFQFGLVFAGMTTIEFQEKIRISHDADEADYLSRNKCMISCIKFDRGTYQNFLEVFGSRWYLWLLPFPSDFNSNVPDDGTYYTTIYASEETSMFT